MQRVEQPNAIGHSADLDEIFSGQTQNIRRGEAGECRLERVESARAKPGSRLRGIRVGR